jgi:CRISPR-associated protein Cst1
MTTARNSERPLLDYVGHPLVDVGAAAIAAFVSKEHPREVSVADLEQVAAYLEREYQREYMRGYLTCVFPNAAYVNPIAGPEKKQAFLQAHLYSFRETAAADADPCALCVRPAAVRGFRQHVPMLTGEGVLNFFPNARPGLPLCSGCMISIAALPLGALKCRGRALIVHADEPALTLHFARAHVQRNRQLLQLRGLAEDARYPDAKEPRTRLIEQLREWAEKEATQSWQARRGRALPTSLTAYHLTNSGQGPDLDLYPLPAPLLFFLMDAETDSYRQTWHAIIAAAWRQEEKAAETGAMARRNYLYEEFLRLPEGWERFVRTYFLRRAYRAAPKEDPRRSYALGRELDLIHWPLTELFLREIVAMQEERVRAIREFGDRLADYIAERDPGFWRDLHLTRSYGRFRVRLINASQAEQRAERPPLIGFDDFVTIFEYGEDLARPDWRLARDLVLIRVIERLHERRWFAAHPEALEVEAPEDEVPETVTETTA